MDIGSRNENNKTTIKYKKTLKNQIQQSFFLLRSTIFSEKSWQVGINPLLARI